jgi:regulator of sigma E protease
MSVLIFIIVLVVLIVVHELGHFVVAKLSGMRVDEFGLGYPPKIVGKKYKGTEYSLNWLPFGGFVKIHGEDLEEGRAKTLKGDAFTDKPRHIQALVLIAGILMNLVFAWLLIYITLVMGAPKMLSAEEALVTPGAALTVTQVLKGSPADTAGLKAGDTILSAAGPHGNFTETTPEAFTAYVGADVSGTPISFRVMRAGEERLFTASPEAGVVKDEPNRKIIGVTVATVATVSTPPFEAIGESLKTTAHLTVRTGEGLLAFFGSVFSLSADLSQVSGPVGIAGVVGDASHSGLASLLTITALISINLALINVLPIPALDGGRLFFVIIESVTRKPIWPKLAGALNVLGFGFLILLMVAITVSDIFKIAA